jgi:hypothetical protein
MAGLVREFNEGQDRYEVALTSAGDRTSSPDLEGFLAAQRAGHPPDLFRGRITYFGVPGHPRREQAFVGVASCLLTFRTLHGRRGACNRTGPDPDSETTCRGASCRWRRRIQCAERIGSSDGNHE